MSLYIEGLEMPKSGENLTLVITPEGKCYSNVWNSTLDCGLKGNAIPVPPHGDLIDKTALQKDISECVVLSGRRPNPEITGANKITSRINYAPTIIPADETNT